MRKLIFILLAFVVLVSCKTETKKSVMVVKPTVFSEKMAEHKGQVIDVRTPEEYHAGHIKDAVNIHLYDKDFEERIAKLDKDMPVYIYCKAGGRSAEAVKVFEENGFTRIVELDGGTDAWKEAHKPLIK